MKKRFLTASVAGLIGVMMGASGAFAATPVIMDTTVGPGYTRHYIAYEVYNDATGINADNVPFFVKTGASIDTGAAVNIQVSHGKVNEGSGLLFLSARGADINLTNPCGGTPLDGLTWYLIGESTAQGVVTPATIAVYDNATFCTRNGLGGAANATLTGITLAGTVVSTEIGSVNPAGVANTTVKEAINLAVDAGLGPRCDYQPTVSLAYVTNKEVAGPTVVLQIVPQIVGYEGPTAFNATLNTDVDFKQFITGSGPNVGPGADTITSAIGTAPPVPVVTLIDQQTEGIFTSPTLPLGTPGLFDAFVAPTATTSLTIALTSAAAEPGVSIRYNGNLLTNTVNTWTTVPSDAGTLAQITNSNRLPLILNNNPTIEMNPTTWTISNFALTVNNFATCVLPRPPYAIGSWAGGLEAYVPFMKSGNGYETYVKLSNRYQPLNAPFAVKVYIAAMNPITSSVITSTLQLPAPQDSIPTNGQLVISGADLVNAGIITADMAAQGTPIKFLIRVPQQLVDLTNDPYITGAVVSTTPTTQRTMNLDFKWLKNGGLSNH